MANALKGIEPQIVWDYFEQICQVPRPSKKEEKIAAFIENWAKEHNFEAEKDNTDGKKALSHSHPFSSREGVSRLL